MLRQQWYFDEKDKLIKNNYWKGWFLEMKSNGNHPYIEMKSGPNSRWW